MSISMQKWGKINFGGRWLTLGKGVWLKKDGEQQRLVLPLYRFNYMRMNMFGAKMSFKDRPFYDGLPREKIMNKSLRESYDYLKNEYFSANSANYYNIYALDKMSRVCYDLKRYDEVIKYCDIILEQKHDDSRALDREGEAYLMMRMSEEAENCFDRIIEKKNDDYQAWDGKGRANLQRKMYAEAERCFKKIYDQNSRDVPALDGLMRATFAQKKYDEAEYYCHQLIKVSPQEGFAPLILEDIARIRDKKN